MTIDTADWMDLVKGSKLLSELSIPGTHDSGARDPDTSLELTKIRLTTQDRTIAQQLLDGIRFLDIRARYIRNEFRIYHEDVYLNLTFAQVLTDCRTFLAQHPRETIIMSIKEESSAEGNTAGVTFQARFKAYCDEHPELWYLKNEIPALADVRGKIVLFRRFPLDTTTPAARASTTIASAATGGIDADDFKENATFTLAGPPTLEIQDGFRIDIPGNLPGKYRNVKALLDRASEPSSRPDTLFVNFASGAGGGLDTRPVDVANFINPRLEEYFGEDDHQRGRFGIVLTDFETAGRNTLIIRTNFILDEGYWIANLNGSVDALGTAPELPVFGPPAPEAIAIGVRRDGNGYYLLASSGEVFTYGSARKPPPAAEGDGRFPPTGTQAAAIAVKPDAVAPAGPGYWILARNGKVRGYNANHHGEIEAGADLLAVSLVATPDAGGYWILASNGRIHAYGNADHFGDRRDDGKTAVGMARTPDGGGYWILTSNGAVRHFGNAGHYDSGVDNGETAYAIAATRDGTGYWILSTNGKIHPYGSARYLGRSRHAVAIAIAADPRPLPAGT